jgi:hypothetical protein
MMTTSPREGEDRKEGKRRRAEEKKGRKEEGKKGRREGREEAYLSSIQWYPQT